MHKFENINPATADKWLVAPRDWRKPHAGGSYEIIWDRARSFGQIKNRPTPREAFESYQVEEYYTHRKRERKTKGKVGLAQRLIGKISWLLDGSIEPSKEWWSKLLGREELKIIEIGCGNGSNLSMLKSLGHNVIGVDPDPAALEVARSEGHIVYNGTAESLPIEVLSDRFDVVIFMHVLEHCINPDQAMAGAIGVLKKNGTLVAEVPNNSCVGLDQFGELWYWLDVPRHLNFFTTESLCNLIRTHGLTIENVFFRGYCRQFSPEWKAAQREIANAFGIPNDRRLWHSKYWLLLVKTAWARSTRKYDSVRVIGRLS